jgi:hypothetical protein
VVREASQAGGQVAASAAASAAVDDASTLLQSAAPGWGRQALNDFSRGCAYVGGWQPAWRATVATLEGGCSRESRDAAVLAAYSAAFAVLEPTINALRESAFDLLDTLIATDVGTG